MLDKFSFKIVNLTGLMLKLLNTLNKENNYITKVQIRKRNKVKKNNKVLLKMLKRKRQKRRNNKLKDKGQAKRRKKRKTKRRKSYKEPHY